jgi:hypothetical protein
MVGKSDEGHPARLLAELFETLLVTDAACEVFLYRPMIIRCWDGRGETVA